ncbi:MAG: hypothetical protein RIT14_2472 [Pseudomonadota bacterium]|jgi:pilus assembly protein CpaE
MTVAQQIGLEEIVSFGGIAGISISAFTEREDTHRVMEQCRQSRHLADVKFHLEGGGMDAAIEAFRDAQSPHLLIIESHLVDGALMAALDRLAEVCEADTRLVLLGQANDVLLYRELVRRGVSEYLPTPVTVRQVIRAIADIEEQPGGLPKGRVFAFTGTCGGAGSSTMAASVAWVVGHRKRTPVTLIDLDAEFGSLGLNLGVSSLRGVSDALRAGLRLDSQLLEGLLQGYDEFLRILPASDQSIDDQEFSEDAVDRLIDVARSSASYVILDVPSLRTAAARRAVMAADQVFLTATPDLSSLRNAKKLLDTIRRARPDESDPFLILNKVGAVKRMEVPVQEFVDALSVKKFAVVHYDPATVTDAANKGRSLLQADRGPALLSGVEALVQELVGTPVTARLGLLQALKGRLQLRGPRRK